MRKKYETKNSAVRTEIREKDGIYYRYDLIMQESLATASYGIPLYSISVEMQGENGDATKATTKEVFADAGLAINFFEKLVYNLATPIDLPYVVEDEIMR